MGSNVALVNMPFANAERPSLALGLLKSLARESNWSAQVLNFNLPFARRIGTRAYTFLCGASVTTSEHTRRVTVSMDHLIGEWLFSQWFYDKTQSQIEEYADFLYLQSDFSRALCDAIMEIRLEIAAFMEECLSATDWGQYALVGFTSTFEQTMASLCLAREIKRRFPQTKIVLGGANCESVMGVALARNFEFLDLVCTGEADSAFPELLQRLESHGEWWRVPGFTARAHGTLHQNPPAPLTVNLDALPHPDFDEYFAERERSGWHKSHRGVILETSRGCWWGQKSHCTFCGLNGSTMGFRVKTPQRALEEFRHIVARYRIDHVDYSDNILHREYIDSYLPQLALEARVRSRPVSVFYETKSNLKRDELKALAQANVSSIQPGIESFDDSVLRLMGKGVRGLHNVAVLKWGRLYEVSVLWNLIFGFPGESRAAYEWMADLFRRIVHLQPPRTVSPIRLDRFSPNFTQAQKKGLTDIHPKPAYGHVFALPDAELRDVAYFFDFSYADGRDPLSYTVALEDAFADWETTWRQRSPTLRADALPDGGLTIADTRYSPIANHHVMTPAEATLYLYFDTPHASQTVTSLARELGCTDSDLEKYLESWDAARLIARHADYVVALAIADDATLRECSTQLIRPSVAKQIVSTTVS